MDSEPLRINRRTVVAGTGVVVATAMAACATDDSSPSASSSATTSPPGSPTTTPAPPLQPTTTEPTLAPGAVTTADIPVGGGKIIGAAVVTQPSPGDFRAFSSICPHAGCAVSNITGGTINCPCHGSMFNLDGSVAAGPATTPLVAWGVVVDGDSLIVQPGGGPAPEPAPEPAPPAPVSGTVTVPEVPIGGGVIVGDVVVTQPSRGDFRAFSSICPHAGCAVTSVSGGTVNCPCHGSKFNLDGSVAIGPAASPLVRRDVVVRGESIDVAPGGAPVPPQAPEQPQNRDRPAPGGAAPGNGIVRTADVPVGGGVIVGNIVVTQPSPGNFRGLSAICTHQGCPVSSVSGGTIDCNCHGSKFNLDGSVAVGPATRPLGNEDVDVDGEWIVQSSVLYRAPWGPR